MDEGNRGSESCEEKDNETRRRMEEIRAQVERFESKIGEATATTSELRYIRGKVADYLVQTLSLKEDFTNGVVEESELGEKIREFFREHAAELGVFAGYLAKKREVLTEKRDEATKHMDVLKENHRTAIPLMQEAEAAIQGLYTEKDQIEARLAQELSLEERSKVENEYDSLKDTWFIMGEKLAEATYTVELSSNLLRSMAVYKASIDNLIADVEGVGEIIEVLPYHQAD